MSAAHGLHRARARVVEVCVRLLLAFGLLAVAQSTWAVRCLTSSGADQFVEPIGSVQTYPVNAPDGYVIWISPTRTTTGYCYKDLGAGSLTFDDPISFYANPNGENPLAWGLEIGIRYLGVDYFGAGNQPGTGVPTGFVVPICSDANFAEGLCPKIPVSITYQVVVRKAGTWVGIPQDTYAAFQFDGVKGLNCCNTSFRYILSGLENLKPTPCVVDVTVTPEPGIVDFGSVQATPTGFSPVTPTQPFSLALTKQQCDTSVKIQGYLDTSNPVQGNLVLPSSDSGFGVAIHDAKGAEVPLREPFDLANFSATQTRIDVPFTATLKSLGRPKIGPFTATVTVQVLYD
ncbi:fimbrial protein [Burkholderia paludis]|uniref:fimbrial protein n=1 Tax=Burkholderia paludis TaxID=1506587 RepID=UPI0004DB7FCE|nr:fimbrial protein [Burkholderia paludis]KFG98581.1 fimbrial protein [Burkholderia paludis]